MGLCLRSMEVAFFQMPSVHRSWPAQQFMLVDSWLVILCTWSIALLHAEKGPANDSISFFSCSKSEDKVAWAQFFPFPTLVALLQISRPSFSFYITNLAPFMKWSTTSSNLLTGTRKFTSILCFSPATPTILGFTEREMSLLRTRLHWQCHWNPKLCGQQRAVPPAPLWSLINGGNTPFKIPPLYLAESATEKT